MDWNAWVHEHPLYDDNDLCPVGKTQHRCACACTRDPRELCHYGDTGWRDGSETDCAWCLAREEARRRSK